MAKQKSEALKDKGGKNSKGTTLQMALKDIEPPVDPNSMVPQTEAKTRCKKAAEKLSSKGNDLDFVAVGIGKTNKPLALSVKQQCKELKTKVNAHCKLLSKCAVLKNEKVNMEELKNACTVAANLLDEIKQIMMIAKPLLPSSKTSSIDGN